MNWKFWNRGKVESHAVPVSTLFKWALFDLGVKHVNSFASEGGFTGISEEGIEVERKDSNERLLALDPLTDFIAMMSIINAQITASSDVKKLKDTGLLKDDLPEDEVKDALAETYLSISTASIITAFSAALSLGLVANTNTVSTQSGYINEF